MGSNTATIVEILTCSKKELPKVAEKHQMKPVAANVVREHWLRRLTGICVKCGMTVREEKCRICGTTVESNAPLLQCLDPDCKLVSCTCENCKKPFSYTAGQVLKLSETYGVFRPSRFCKPCRDKARRKQEDLKAKKTGVAPKSKKPQIRTNKKTGVVIEPPELVKDLDPIKVHIKSVGQLTHRPFEALKGLIIPVVSTGDQKQCKK
jgi:hypothetical protein